jgi:hypothetical protein
MKCIIFAVVFISEKQNIPMKGEGGRWTFGCRSSHAHDTEEGCMIMDLIEKHPILEFKHGKKVKFTFDGNEMEGYEGEPIAAALHANGVRIYRVYPRERADAGVLLCYRKMFFLFHGR